jgi:hypothetical protein
MKNYSFYMIALSLVLLLTNCKKEKTTPFITSSESINAELTLATAAPSKLTVETVYGSPYATGELVNGNASTARFYDPRGLQFVPDGTLFVADMKNNAIRKISAAGMVSTLKLQPAPFGAELIKPVYLGVSWNTGTLHILQDGNTDHDAYDQSWIFKSNGDFVATDYTYYVNATAMTRDPYTDKFYFSSGSGIDQSMAQPEGLIYGPGGPDYDPEKLVDPSVYLKRGFSWDALAIGYNKVFYFTSGSAIYKYTPSGVTERIFTNLTGITKITCMILNRDSRTVYIADNGYIKRIDSGKLTVLAGPTGKNDGHDGTGLTADVYAFGLALAPGENVLYFTDSKANTIRKIYLK